MGRKELRESMDSRKQFVEEFQQDPDKASHLVSVKRYYRLIKMGGLGGIFVFYLAVFAASLTDANISWDALKWVYVPVFALIGLGFVLLIVLRLDLSRHDITDNELALHELSQAVSTFNSESVDHEKCSRHLSNAYMLIAHHEARPFSKQKERQFGSYVDWLEEKEPESGDNTHFEYVFEHYLEDLIEEVDLSPEWEESEELTDTDTGGFISTILQSLENIVDQPGAKRWGPIIAVLILGFAIFFVYNERLGSMITIALLTVISLGRSQSS